MRVKIQGKMPDLGAIMAIRNRCFSLGEHLVLLHSRVFVGLGCQTNVIGHGIEHLVCAVDTLKLFGGNSSRLLVLLLVGVEFDTPRWWMVG